VNPVYSLGLVLSLLALCWCYAWLGLRISGSAAAVPAPRRFAAIDGLRGFLALSVFVHHAFCTRVWYVTGAWSGAGNQVFLQAGWAAVTLFFFITGFLFWTKIHREPHLSFLRHLRSRLRRLGPAYWAAVAVVLLVVAFRTGWRLQVAPSQLVRPLVDWVFFALTGLGDINGLAETRNIIAGVPWTLALEWVFYLLVPLLGWFASGIFRTLLFLGLAYVALRLLLLDSETLLLPRTLRYLATQSAYHLTRTFAGGIILAVVLPRFRSHLEKVDFRRPLFSAIGLGGVLAVMLFSDPVYAFRQSLPLLVPFALIALGNDWFGVLTSRPAQLLGRVSYSIYLLHGLVLHLTFLGVNRLSPVAGIPEPVYWLTIAGLGAVVVGIAACWYRWFEAPFLSR
jgi:peptidoglycan/LPS O-acetylase OafA/YrhL